MTAPATAPAATAGSGPSIEPTVWTARYPPIGKARSVGIQRAKNMRGVSISVLSTHPVEYTVRMSTSTPSHARRPRGSLNRDLILDAAEAVAQEGFESLTLRAVAARIEAAPMALYRHFATKEQLVNALLDRVLGRFAPAPPSGDWVADLRAFALSHRQLLDRHPWALAALFSHPNPGLNATRIGEVALAILSRAGFADERVVATFSGLIALNY